MWNTPALALIAAVFVLAGCIKGMVGFGLPMVVIAILTAVHGLTEAMGLMLVPSLATNLWQALAGGRLAEIVRRLWSFLAAISVFVWLASGLLARADASVLTGGLGLLLVAYALASLATPQVPPPGRHERWMSPLVGAVNGAITGLTGTYVLPSGLYLQALGLRRDILVQAMGVVFTLSTVMVAVALAGRSLIGGDVIVLSALALAPTFAGLAIGQRLRRRLPEARFRAVFFIALAVMGVYLAWRAATTLG
jgi:hypothetical protein